MNTYIMHNNIAIKLVSTIKKPDTKTWETVVHPVADHFYAKHPWCEVITDVVIDQATATNQFKARINHWKMYHKYSI